jgi:hypothetical protein
MRIPGVPGPRDLFAAGERAVALVDDLVAAVPRVTALLDAAEALVTDARGVIGRIEAAADDADALLVAFTATQLRIVEILDRMQPPLAALQPTLERLAETTDPSEVDALVGLVDRLPALAEQVERDVVPIMRTLGTVAPDLHELLDTSRELNEMLAKVPGLSRLLDR